MANRERPRGDLGLAVAARITAEIKAQRLTFAEVERRMAAHGRPVGAEAVSRMASGERSIDIDDLGAVAAALKLHVFDLVIPTEVDETRWKVDLERTRGQFTYRYLRTADDHTPMSELIHIARMMARLADAALRATAPPQNDQETRDGDC